MSTLCIRSSLEFGAVLLEPRNFFARSMTPLARFKGWQSVRDDLYVNFLQKAFTDRNLQADNFALTVSGNAALSVYDWTFTAKLPNGQAFSSKGWETHVYQKVDGRWVIATFITRVQSNHQPSHHRNNDTCEDEHS